VASFPSVQGDLNFCVNTFWLDTVILKYLTCVIFSKDLYVSPNLIKQ